jgi:putative DNA primase/helicase
MPNETTTTTDTNEGFSVPDDTSELTPAGSGNGTKEKYDAAERVRKTKFGAQDADHGRRLGRWLLATGTYRWIMGQTNGMFWNPKRGIWEEDFANRPLAIAANVARFDSETAEMSRSLTRMRAAIVQCRSEVPELVMPAEEFDNRPFLLAHPNGTTTDLRTGVTSASLPEDYLTKTTAVSPAEMPTPRFDAFMQQATLEDQSMAEYIRCTLGMALFGFMARELLFMYVGPTGSGKSTLIEIISEALSTDVLHVLSGDIFTPDGLKPNQIADLKGMRLAIINELPDAKASRGRATVDAGAFKSLLTNGTVSGRQLFQRTVVYKTTASFIATTNHALEIPGGDPAVKRRGIVVPFMFRPTTPDANLRSNITENELPGILNWVIEGASRMFSASWELPECTAVEEATEKWKQESDTVNDFVETCLIAAPEHRILRSELGTAWKKFNATEEIDKFRLISTVADLLLQRGVITKNKIMTGNWRVEGVKILPRDEHGWTKGAINMLIAAGDPRGDEFAENRKNNAARALSHTVPAVPAPTTGYVGADAEDFGDVPITLAGRVVDAQRYYYFDDDAARLARGERCLDNEVSYYTESN